MRKYLMIVPEATAPAGAEAGVHWIEALDARSPCRIEIDVQAESPR